MHARLSFILVCASLCSCATQRVEMRWLRADGKPITEDQLEAARTACVPEIQNAGSPAESVKADGVFRACMSERGYIQAINK